MGWIRTCLRDSWPHRVGRVNLAQPYADEKESTTKGTTALPCYATPIGAACRPDIEASVIASSVATARCLLTACSLRLRALKDALSFIICLSSPLS